jgi:hypothetical protein
VYTSNVVATIWVNLYMVFPIYVIAATDLIDCQNIEGTLYLRMDLNQQCYDGTHLIQAIKLGVPMLLLMLGYPLSLFVVLQPNRENLEEQAVIEKHCFLY